MNRWHFDQQVDLKSGAGDVIWPNALMMEGDNQAHAWQVQVRDGGKAVDMSLYGITAYFQRTDGKTVVVVGSAEGDKATVLLPQSAYAVPGQLLGVMRASSGGGNLTLAACRWTVRNAPDGEYIDPGHVVHSLPELLDRIAEMENATAAANAAVGSANDAKASALNAAAEARSAAEDAEAARQAADQAAKAAADATKTAEEAWQALTGDVTQAKNAAEEAAEVANAAAAKATEAAGSVDASKAAAQAAAAEARAAAGSVDDAKGEALAAAGTANDAAQAADEAREGIQGELSALKDDLSDKLPKSPADWESWTAEQKAEARERMGIQEPILLEQIVISDEVSSVERSACADGTPYNLKAIYIYITLGDCSQYETRGSFVARFGNKNYIRSNVSDISNTTLAQAAHISVAMYQKNGFWIGELDYQVFAQYPSSSHYFYTKFDEDVDSIKKIILSFNSGFNFPSGSIIKIFGVMA